MGAPCGLYAAAISGAPSCAQFVIVSSVYVRLQLGQRFMKFRFPLSIREGLTPRGLLIREIQD